MLVGVFRSLIAVQILLLGCASSEAASEPYPVPHNRNLREIVAAPQDWHDRIIGIRGRVGEIESGPKGKPQIRVAALGPNGEEYTLWVGSLITPPEGWLAIGHTIRMVGWFTFIPPFEAQPGVSTRLMGGYHLLAQCIVNETTSLALMLPSGRKQCDRWLRGEHPEALQPGPDKS